MSSDIQSGETLSEVGERADAESVKAFSPWWLHAMLFFCPILLLVQNDTDSVWFWIGAAAACLLVVDLIRSRTHPAFHLSSSRLTVGSGHFERAQIFELEDVVLWGWNERYLYFRTRQGSEENVGVGHIRMADLKRLVARLEQLDIPQDQAALEVERAEWCENKRWMLTFGVLVALAIFHYLLS